MGPLELLSKANYCEAGAFGGALKFALNSVSGGGAFLTLAMLRWTLAKGGGHRQRWGGTSQWRHRHLQCGGVR